jgi:hypothetical protein
MTLKQLKQNILAYADLKHKFNDDYSACLKQASDFYLKLCFNGKIKPSSIKFANFWN